MIDKINPSFTVNFKSHPNSKSSAETPISNPLNPKCSFKGAESLANYNSAFINYNDKFNIPTLDLIVPLDKMNQISGEKIYNSDGEIVQIVDEDENFKTTYTPSVYNKDIYNVEVFDKQKEKIIKSQEYYNSVDGNTYITVNEDKEQLLVNCYKCFEGNVTLAYKSKPIDANNTIDYDVRKQEYSIYKDDTLTVYDKNKQLKSIIEYNGNNSCETQYFNNNPVSTETTKFNSVPSSKTLVNPFVDEDLKPTEYYNIGETKNVKGKKLYYSNGQLEKIVTPEGKVYNYDLDGEFVSVKDGNKTIYGNRNGQEIEEDLGKGYKRLTNYDENNQATLVEYKKDDIYKTLGKLPDGSMYYQQCDDGYSVLQIDYDKDKNIKNQMVWYHDDN